MPLFSGSKSVAKRHVFSTVFGLLTSTPIKDGLSSIFDEAEKMTSPSFDVYLFELHAEKKTLQVTMTERNKDVFLALKDISAS